MNCINFAALCRKDTVENTIYFLQKNVGLCENINTITHTINRTRIIRHNPISFIRRKYERRDGIFWGSYGISKRNLEEDDIPAISGFRGYTKQGKEFTTSCFDLAYHLPFKTKSKIYRPYPPKGTLKWFTNTTENDVGGINTLIKNENKIIITKSYKDSRVLRNINANNIYFQNEGMCPSIPILEKILKGITYVYIFFDNDRTGMIASLAIQEFLSKELKNKTISRIFIPLKEFKKNGIVDPSDYRKFYNEKKLIKLLAQFNYNL